MSTQIEETSLPPSVLTKSQFKTFRKDYIDENGDPGVIIATVRHDDECGNGHNSFAITAEIYDRERLPGESSIVHANGKKLWCGAGGCCHDEVAKHFPELAPFIKWHLTSTDGPMHYVGNTVFHAGDKDCWGLRKGEFRQHTSRGPHQNGGVAGVPNWVLRLPDRAERDVYSPTKPAPVVLEWQPEGRTGEGKERDLNAARHCAVWPEATDEELTAPGLEERLIARLPALMQAFKADVESLGLVY